MKGCSHCALAALLALCPVVLVGCSGSGRHADATVLAGTGVLPPPASAGPAAQYDARHSSGTRAIGPQHGTLRWTGRITRDLTPGPVIGVDGSGLQASNAGTLTAIDPSEVWVDLLAQGTSRT